MSEAFSGPSAVAFSNEDVVAPAKVLADFAKDAENLEIKAGVIEGKVSSKEEIQAIASLPSRDGLLSMLLSVLQAPVRNVAPVSYTHLLEQLIFLIWVLYQLL